MAALDSNGYSTLSPEEMLIGLEVAGVAIGSVDYVDDSIRLDPMSAALFDLPAGIPVARDALHARIHRDDWPEVQREVETLLDPDKTDVIDLVHRVVTSDGEIRWLHVRKRITFARERGSVRPVSGVFALMDVTDRRAAELRSDMLAKELNHRTKNLMTVIMGIARQIARSSEPEHFPERLLERLQALSRNQDAIAAGEQRDSDLRAVIGQQLKPFDGTMHNRVSLSGPDVSISASGTVVLSMMMHELLTNAVKYGALSATEGAVDIDWQIEDGASPRLFLSWRERNGPPVAAPAQRGFGTQVLTVLVEATFGATVSIDYRPDGLVVEVAGPLERFLGHA